MRQFGYSSAYASACATTSLWRGVLRCVATSSSSSAPLSPSPPSLSPHPSLLSRDGSQPSAASAARVRRTMPQRRATTWAAPSPLLGGSGGALLVPTEQRNTVASPSVLPSGSSPRRLIADSQRLRIASMKVDPSRHRSAGDEALENAMRYAPAPLLITRFAAQGGGVEWVDVAAHPTSALEDYRDAIATFLVDVGAHETLVEATLESVLLPQTTIVDDCRCLVVRCAVEDTSFEMDSIQELTNRLTILVFGTDRVVTVHRTHMPQIKLLQKQWNDEQGPDGAASSAASLALYLVKEASRSFHRALAKSIVQFDSYEAKLFAPQKGRSSLAREIYHIKRRASVYSRILALTHDSFSTFLESLGVQPNNVYVQDVVQDLAHVRSLSDELNDNANSVLQLLFQLSSYQLNELMRVLTMFSAFFIPLGFIASVYGMNFESLPGIDHPYGHLYCLGFMLMVGLSLVSWFKWKRFW